jgi:hypothetical protein
LRACEARICSRVLTWCPSSTAQGPSKAAYGQTCGLTLLTGACAASGRLRRSNGLSEPDVSANQGVKWTSCCPQRAPVDHLRSHTRARVDLRAHECDDERHDGSGKCQRSQGDKCLRERGYAVLLFDRAPVPYLCVLREHADEFSHLDGGTP